MTTWRLLGALALIAFQGLGVAMAAEEGVPDAPLLLVSPLDRSNQSTGGGDAVPAGARSAQSEESSGPALLRRRAVAEPAPGRALIAVVIDDVGVDRRRSVRAALTLPAPMTMAIMPYARDVAPLAVAARAHGHELIAHLPMEALDPNEDPGPYALTLELSPEETLRRLDWHLGRFEGYVGASNHMGSRLTEDAERMGAVLGELKARGLMFLDSKTNGHSVAGRVALSLGLPFAERDVFLDNERSADGVRARLGELEAVARRRGYAVGIGHPHDATIEALAEWAKGLEARGFILVPISAISRLRGNNDS